MNNSKNEKLNENKLEEISGGSFNYETITNPLNSRPHHSNTLITNPTIGQKYFVETADRWFIGVLNSKKENSTILNFKIINDSIFFTEGKVESFDINKIKIYKV